MGIISKLWNCIKEGVREVFPQTLAPDMQESPAWTVNGVDELESRAAKIGTAIPELDLVLSTAKTEYEQIAFKIFDAQETALRNYLWIATFVLPAELLLLSQVQGMWLILGAVWLRLALCICAVFMTIYGLLGYRTSSYMPISYVDLAERLLSEKALRLFMIEQMAASVEEAKEFTRKRSCRMRWICRIIMASIFIGVLMFAINRMMS
jgi:hypothetical protein